MGWWDGVGLRARAAPAGAGAIRGSLRRLRLGPSRDRAAHAAHDRAAPLGARPRLQYVDTDDELTMTIRTGRRVRRLAGGGRAGGWGAPHRPRASAGSPCRGRRWACPSIWRLTPWPAAAPPRCAPPPQPPARRGRPHERTHRIRRPPRPFPAQDRLPPRSWRCHADLPWRGGSRDTTSAASATTTRSRAPST